MRNTKSDRDWDVPVIKRPTEKKNVYQEKQKVKRKTTTTTKIKVGREIYSLGDRRDAYCLTQQQVKYKQPTKCYTTKIIYQVV